MKASRKYKRTLKISTILSLIPLGVISYFLPTSYRRDVWFSSDGTVVHYITQNGQLPTSTFQLFAGNIVDPFTGGASSSIDHFLTPILRTTLVMVTGVEASVLSISLPYYLIKVVISIAILKHLDINQEFAIIFGVLLGIAPVFTVSEFLDAGMSASIILFTGILLTIRYISGFKEASLLLSVIFIWIGIQKPELWLLLLGVLIISLALRFTENLSASDFYRAPVIVALSMLPHIISFNVYRYHIASIIESVQNLHFPTPTGGGSGNTPYILPNESYGLIILIIVLAWGIIGGGIFLSNFIESHSKNSLYATKGVDTVVVSWAISVILLTIIIISSGKFFLITRSYSYSFPIIIIGAAIAIDQMYKRERIFSYIYIGVIVFAFVGVLILQTQTPHMQIGLLQSDGEAWAEWSSEYSSDLVILADRKAGAQLVDQGHDNTKVPTSQASVHSLYYSNYTSFQKYTNDNGDQVSLYYDMKSTGLYTNSYPRKPMNNTSFDSRVTNNSVIYSNGEYITLEIDD
jgi:hypothetical protein